MICSQCTHANPPDIDFCEECGSTLNDAAEDTAATYDPQAEFSTLDNAHREPPMGLFAIAIAGGLGVLITTFALCSGGDSSDWSVTTPKHYSECETACGLFDARAAHVTDPDLLDFAQFRESAAELCHNETFRAVMRSYNACESRCSMYDRECGASCMLIVTDAAGISY